MQFVLRDFTASIAAPALQQIADALAAQLNEDVSPEWGGGHTVRVGATTETLADNEIDLAVFQHADQANAAGYHATDPRGKPYAKAFLDDADGIASGAFPLSGILSHEAIETAIDPGANRFAMRADGVTIEALEGADRCEDTGYTKKDVYVSNFLLQSAFDPGAAGPYTFLDVGKPQAEWCIQAQDGQTPGGYAILGSFTENAAATMLVSASEERLADEKWRKRKSFEGARTMRRNAAIPKKLISDTPPAA